MPNSSRDSGHRRRQFGTSSSDHATSSSRPDTAAIGIAASSVALTPTSASSHSAEHTAANGVRAPISRLGIERLSEPHDRKHEKKPPTTLDRPWPTNSRLASTCWPERAASTLAIENDWPSDTMV